MGAVRKTLRKQTEIIWFNLDGQNAYQGFFVRPACALSIG